MTDTKGCRLENSGWEPDEQARSFAISYGLDPDKVWPQFRDYWIAKTGAGATKKDWLATWRTWCRRAEGDRKLALESTPARSNGQRGPSNDPTVQAIMNGEIDKDPVTGKPRVTVDGREYGVQDAWRIKRRRGSRWGITDHERRVLQAWRMA